MSVLVPVSAANFSAVGQAGYAVGLPYTSLICMDMVGSVLVMSFSPEVEQNPAYGAGAVQDEEEFVECHGVLHVGRWGGDDVQAD